MKNYYYVYYSYEEWGRGYIGYRGCNCLPEEDVKYFGSFTDKTFKPTQKNILQTFNTEKEALEAEIILHSFYKVDINPHFANQAKQTSTKFSFNATGITRSEETRRKIGEKSQGRKHSEKSRKKMSEQRRGKLCGELNPMFGKPRSESTKQKLREANLGKIIPETLKKQISKKISSKKWFNNGLINARQLDCPDGFVPGRLYFSRKSSTNGKRWFTNGIDERLCDTCPIGYRQGRSLKTRS
jgi:hypothetical protein